MTTRETIWRTKPCPDGARKLMECTGITPLQAQLLVQRGISSEEEASSFLNPRLSQLREPFHMKDMEAAVDRIVWAAERGKTVCIYGDFDADGLTATALLCRFLSELGLDVLSYIPSRLEEGYGLNHEAMSTIAESRAKVIVTVDCGSTDLEEIDHALGLGLEVIVTDHHKVPDDLQPPCPLINPHRSGCPFPFKELAGVGVAFCLAAAVRAGLRRKGRFGATREPDLRRLLDLVAIGTLADMVPLVQENRILTTAGLGVLQATSWPGLTALQGVSGISPALVSYEDVAYRLAPLINAAGRMGSALEGLEILTTSDTAVARDLSERLLSLNRERQASENRILERVKSELPSPADMDGRRTLVIWGAGWHRGVLGIVASRLVEQYNRPVLVLSTQNGIAAGSGRSIQGFDLHNALLGLRPILKTFGGHRHAVGLSLDAKDLEALCRGLEEAGREQLDDSDLSPTVETDLELPPSRITCDTVDEIEKLGPFGTGNPQPVFLGRGLKVLEARVVGGRHLKVLLSCDGAVHESIGFGLADRSVPLQKGDRIQAAYTPMMNRWQGIERLQLKLIALDYDSSTA